MASTASKNQVSRVDELSHKVSTSCLRICCELSQKRVDEFFCRREVLFQRVLSSGFVGSLGISASGISVSRDPVIFGVFLWFSVIVRIL